MGIFSIVILIIINLDKLLISPISARCLQIESAVIYTLSEKKRVYNILAITVTVLDIILVIFDMNCPNSILRCKKKKPENLAKHCDIDIQYISYFTIEMVYVKNYENISAVVWKSKKVKVQVKSKKSSTLYL